MLGADWLKVTYLTVGCRTIAKTIIVARSSAYARSYCVQNCELNIKVARWQCWRAIRVVIFAEYKRL